MLLARRRLERRYPGAAVVAVRSLPETVEAILLLGGVVGSTKRLHVVVHDAGVDVWSGWGARHVLEIPYPAITKAAIAIAAIRLGGGIDDQGYDYLSGIELHVEYPGAPVRLPLIPWSPLGVDGDDHTELLALELQSRADLPWVDADRQPPG